MCWVYILTNKNNTVLYTGMTNNLERRVFEHKQKLIDGFTKKYNINKLVYCESFPTAIDAINAEKKIKGWLRIKKIKLIKTNNPNWEDLSDKSFCPA
jgi:putative endonuclease